MTNITPFTFDTHPVRVIERDGEPWFVAADCAHALEYRDAANLIRGLDPEDRGTHNLSTPSGAQEMTIISEGGLYTALVRARTERAKPFRRWVTHEVLPAIRRHGLYATPRTAEEILSDPDTMIRILQDLKAERAARASLEAQAVADRPKVLFADAVSTSSSEILVGDLAKILRGNGIPVGANRLFAWLRNNGFLIRRDGSDWNMPTQKSMELELFRVKETAVVHSDGHTSLSKTPKVTGKGQQYFIDGFLSGRFSIEDGAA